MAKSTTLRAKATNEILYPQTKAEVVYTLDGSDVESKLQNINGILSELENARDYKGYFATEQKLLNKYPNNIANPHDREGWYARVGNTGTSDTTMYYWDVEDNAWIVGSKVSIGDVSSVNGIRPNEDGNITINSTDISTTYTNQDGSNKSVQEVFNMLQSEHLDLESEIEAVNGKTTVLYLTNEEMEEAVSPSQLLSRYSDGQVVVCNDDGNYKLGSSYKYIAIETEGNPVNAWEEITSSGSSNEITAEEITLSKTVFIPPVEHTETYSDVYATTPFVQDGDYWSSQFMAEYRSAVCKVEFTLSRKADVIFEYDVALQEEWHSNLSCFYFGDIDFEAPTNYDTHNGYPYSTGESNSGTLIYKDMPEGTHFIYVKFNLWNNTGVGKFRVKGFVDEDGREYTSSSTISVGDNNNLTVDSKDVATKDDVSTKILVGTEEEPILFNELTEGSYKISGFVKYSPMTELGKVFSYNNYGEKVDASAYITVLPTVEEETVFAYFNNCSLYEFGVLVHTSNWYAYNFGNYYGFNQWGNSSSTNLNLSEYVTSNQFVTEFERINKTINATRPIEVVDNPLSKNQYSDLNKFFASSDYTNTDLYYTKLTNVETEVKDIVINEISRNLCIKKSITSHQVNDYYGYINFINCDIMDIYDSIFHYGYYIEGYYENGTLIRISDPFGNYIYEINSGWISLENPNDETFSLAEYFNQYPWYDQNVSAFVTFVNNDWELSQFFKNIETNYTITPIKVNGEGGGSTPSAGGMNYLGEYESTNVYSKDDVVHYSNHFFICLENNTTDVTPNIDMFYTEEGGVTYWRNMGYSATYADRAIADGDGNNISATYATKAEAGIPTLTSPVRIWDLEDGVYKLPANCQVLYRSTTDASNFRIGTNVTGVLTISTGYNTVPATTVAVKNKFWTLYAGGGSVAGLTKYLGRTSEYDGEYNKIREGTLANTISDGRDVTLGNVSERMTGAYNYYLLGSTNNFYDVQRSSGCYIKSNALYSNDSKVATQNDLGTQVTYSLDGTTLTITNK